MLKLSATRISSFLRCKKKYSFQYVEKLPKLANDSFKLGLACHESLELAGNIWMSKQFLSTEDKRAILDKYNQVSVKEGLLDQEMHLAGRQAVKARIDNFDMGGTIISLEDRFGAPDGKFPDLVTSLGVPLLGAMDKIIEIDDSTLLIVDYKTSKTVPTPEQLRADLQLSMYDLVASLLYPKYKRTILCLDMLKHEPVYTYRTPEERSDFNEYLSVIYEAMNSFDPEAAKPTLNVFCPWCDYRDSCSAYVDAHSSTEFNFMPLVDYTNDQLIDEWLKISSTAKILDHRKSELDMFIKEKIKTEGTEVKGTGKQLYIRQNSKVSYDLKTVAELVPQHDLLGMVSLSKKAVDEYCEANPQLKSPILNSGTTSFNAPFIAAKNLKVSKKAAQAVIDSVENETAISEEKE